MACDYCGKRGNGELSALHSWLQTKSIKQICDGCKKKADRKYLKLDSVAMRWKKKKFKQWLEGTRK